MPQLMPFYWINSNFMVFLLLFMLMIMYFYKMENLNSMKFMVIFEKNYLFKW